MVIWAILLSWFFAAVAYVLGKNIAPVYSSVEQAPILLIYAVKDLLWVGLGLHIVISFLAFIWRKEPKYPLLLLSFVFGFWTSFLLLILLIVFEMSGTVSAAR